MSQASAAVDIQGMKVGDHCCGFYRTEAEHRELAVEFIRQGVARGEKIFYIITVRTAAALKAMLAEGGLDVTALVASGQLVILTAKEAYLKEGDFDPQRMVALLEAETDRAIADGYQALRVTGEMSWALAGEPGSERLVEYEARLNEFLPGSRCYAICQYDLRRFDPDMLLDVLHTHPLVLDGTRTYDNSRRYFVPAERFLGADRPAGMLEQWLENLRTAVA
jgi:hypothetical protein